MSEYLQPTPLIDYPHPLIEDFVNKVIEGASSDTEKAVLLYYAIRDGWRYNPYQFSFEPNALQASRIIQKKDGHCLDKAVLLIACLRAAGIPARLCLAKVRNHIAVERLVEAFGTNELVPHGYVDVFLDGHWVKATPAFNKELCEKLNVETLEFDGTYDSMFQQFDRKGGVFMEYLEEYGHFADVPVDFIREVMLKHYARLEETMKILEP